MSTLLLKRSALAQAALLIHESTFHGLRQSAFQFISLSRFNSLFLLQAKSMPGPADYPPPVPPKPSGGKFNMSKPKSDIDWIITRASQMPGPGDTDPGPPPKVSGGKFNTGKSKSDVEWRIYRAAQIPGPADYPPVSRNRAFLRNGST
jgi:hypothetical protein